MMSKFVSYAKFEEAFTCSSVVIRAHSGTVVEALHCEPEGRGINSRWWYWNFSLT
jgi:hypothetical protein